MKRMILWVYFLFRLPFLYLLKSLFFIPQKRIEDISRILVIRIDRIGDLVLSIPVIRNLSLEYPKAQLDILIPSYLEGLTGFIPGIDNVIVYEKFLPTVKKLKAEEYDLVLDLYYGYKLKSALIALFSRAPVRLGFNVGFRGLLFSHAVPMANTIGKNMVNLTLEILSLLNIPVKVALPQLGVTGIGPSAPVAIALHPGAYYPSQRWDKEKFILLGKKILDKFGGKLVIIGGPKDRELAGYIASGINHKDAEAKFPELKDLVAILSGCKLLVCNNSGPLHIASALGVPTVSVMGPTDPLLWSPSGEKDVVINKNADCSPCSRGTCSRHKCMEQISVDEVFSRVRELLGRVYGA